MLLMTTISVLFVMLFPSIEEQNQNISLDPTPPSENDECSYYRCLDHWIGYGKSCYHISNIPKTWEESRTACAELQSHLMKIEMKEELEILSSVLDMNGWIGLKINETSGLWLWEDGTPLNPDMLSTVFRYLYTLREYRF